VPITPPVGYQGVVRQDPRRFRPRDVRAFEEGRRQRDEAARRREEVARRRRHRGHPTRRGRAPRPRAAPPVLHAVGLLAMLAIVSAATAAPFAPGMGLVGILFALMLLNRAMALRPLTASLAGAPPQPPPPPPPPAPDVEWRGSRERFDRLRSDYAAYECDPMGVLRLPALADVAVPSTARFVDAFAEAQALDSDAYPGPDHARRFATAVDGAERAWAAARDAAQRIRLSSLSPAERGAVERIIKLLTTARDSDSEPERLAAYARARSELTKLDQAGVLHVPLPAQAVLDEAARGQLPG
jgi:hypothetical protein